MAEGSRGRRTVMVAVAAVLVLLLGGAAVAGRTGVISSMRDRLPWAAQPAPCKSTAVTVVSAPEMAPVVQQVLSPLAGHVLLDGSCLRVDVRSEAPATTVAGSAAALAASLPQVWVPDSSLWVAQANAWPIRPVGSLGTSPVVLAANSANLGRLGWRGHTVTWAEGLDPRHQIVAPGMTDDAPSLLGLLALSRTLGPGVETEQRIAATILAASRTPAHDPGTALDLARGDSRAAPVLVTSRQRVIEANRQARGRLVAVHPAGVPVQLDFPVLRVGRPFDDPVVVSGADLVTQALLSPGARNAAAAAGFGPPATSAAAGSQDARRAQQAVAARVASFVDLVRTLSLPSRLLAVMDVSLSMKLPVAPGVSRARLAAEAAVGAGKLLADGSAIGVWTFAGRQKDGRPYRQVADIDLLGAPDHLPNSTGDVTHRDVVSRDILAIPRQLAPGGTALYDTALAALRHVRADYDPQATNAVVLITDGGNDYAAGMSLRQFQLAARADAEAHPRLPVLLIAIGIGPTADMKALRAMSAAAGGRAYQALTVAELRTVLFDSIAHRPVRAAASTD